MSRSNTHPEEERALHLKVRGVALWIKGQKGFGSAVIDSAFDTLLKAADVLARASLQASSEPATRQELADKFELGRAHGITHVVDSLHANPEKWGYRAIASPEPVALASSEVDRNAALTERIELGCPGHFIAAMSCRWRRHTQVGNYRVSSVGDYFPGTRGGERETIGAGDRDYFETYVFETAPNLALGNEGCGCREVLSFSEIDGERYATAGDAQSGHERYVEKYAALAAMKETPPDSRVDPAVRES